MGNCSRRTSKDKMKADLIDMACEDMRWMILDQDCVHLRSLVLEILKDQPIYRVLIFY